MTTVAAFDLTTRTDELLTFARQYSLTEREKDVFILLANKTINSTDLGKKLGVSHHTVSNHLKNIFQKTKTGNKAELLSMFICNILEKPKVRSVDQTTTIDASAYRAV